MVRSRFGFVFDDSPVAHTSWAFVIEVVNYLLKKRKEENHINLKAQRGHTNRPSNHHSSYRNILPNIHLSNRPTNHHNSHPILLSNGTLVVTTNILVDDLGDITTSVRRTAGTYVHLGISNGRLIVSDTKESVGEELVDVLPPVTKKDLLLAEIKGIVGSERIGDEDSTDHMLTIIISKGVVNKAWDVVQEDFATSVTIRVVAAVLALIVLLSGLRDNVDQNEEIFGEILANDPLTVIKNYLQTVELIVTVRYKKLVSTTRKEKPSVVVLFNAPVKVLAGTTRTNREDSLISDNLELRELGIFERTSSVITKVVVGVDNTTRVERVDIVDDSVVSIVDVLGLVKEEKIPITYL